MAQFERAAEVARETLAGSSVLNVNSTGAGGGVAEMLQTLLSYARGAGIDARWLVIEGDPAFFAITKRIHNGLYGSPGDGGELGAAERRHYERVLRQNADELLALIRPRRRRLDPRSPAGRPRRGCEERRRACRLALPRRPRPTERVERALVGVPAALPGRSGCDRRLPRGVRAAVGGSGAGARDPALDRPLLGEERADLAAKRPAGARLCRAARRRDRDAARRVRSPGATGRRGGSTGASTSSRRGRRTRRRPARRPGLALGPDEGHGRRDERASSEHVDPVARRAPAALRARRHRRRRRPGGGRGARRVHGALAASYRTPRAAAFTSPASRWPTPTRTRRS